MFFIALLALSVLSIAGSAAFFSVYGLGKVFAGLFLPVVIMGGALEFGKLITVSFLYRYWKDTSKLLRTGLLITSLGLMMITSMGIFGFLSAAYQTDVLPLQAETQQIQLLEQEKAEAEKLKSERLARQEEINKQIANLPDNSVNGRRKLMAANKDELTQINKDVAQYTSDIRQHTLDITKLKGQTLQETVHVGPIVFIAKALGLGVDEAVKWLILLIIIVFDPLAVMLTIAMNIAIVKRKTELMVIQPQPIDVKEEEIPPVVSVPEIIEPPQPTIFTPPVSAPQPRITQPDGWYSTDGGMSFKHPAPDASAPRVGNGWTGQGTLTLGGNYATAPAALSGAAPQPGPFTTFTLGGDPRPALEPQPDFPASVEVPPQSLINPHPEEVVDDPQVQSDLTVFEKALEQFNKPDLSEREKSAKHALEHSIRRYLDLLNPKK